MSLNSKQSLNSEIATLIKQLNYKRINPILTIQDLENLKKELQELVNKVP